MSKSPLREAAVELAWSLWTELGVPGVARHHRHVVIDPEAVVLWSPAVVVDDPRLRDLTFAWCASHGGRLSTSRLRALGRRLPESFRRAFAGFARTLGQVSTVRWPSATGAADWPPPSEHRDVPLPVGRPSMLRFRLRALAGVGARADTLHHILAAWPEPLTATEVAAGGYGKRNVSRLMGELAEAGILTGRRRGNRIEYHLRSPDLLGRLAAAGAAHDLPWVDLFDLLARVLDLETSWAGRPEAARRVQAHKVRLEVTPLAESVGLSSPPVTEGNKDAFPALLDWAAVEVRMLATGTAPALGRRTGWGDGAGSGARDGQGAGDGSGSCLGDGD